MIDTGRSRLDPTIASSMLGVCTSAGCTAIVFGLGTCVAHDLPSPHPTDALLDDTATRAVRAVDNRPRQTLES